MPQDSEDLVEEIEAEEAREKESSLPDPDAMTNDNQVLAITVMS